MTPPLDSLRDKLGRSRFSVPRRKHRSSAASLPTKADYSRTSDRIQCYPPHTGQERKMGNQDSPIYCWPGEAAVQSSATSPSSLPIAPRGHRLRFPTKPTADAEGHQNGNEDQKACGYYSDAPRGNPRETPYGNDSASGQEPSSPVPHMEPRNESRNQGNGLLLQKGERMLPTRVSGVKDGT